MDAKTRDGYVVCLFVIAFPERRPDQVSMNCYAQSARIQKIRRKITEIMAKKFGTVRLRELVKKLIPESTGKEIMKFLWLRGDGGVDAGVAMLRLEDRVGLLSH